MEYVNLTPNIAVSKICFGSLTMAPQQANLSVEQGADLLCYGFAKGITYVDTAQLYDNYDHIGLALKKWGKDNIIISSKTYAYNKTLAKEAVEEARKKLDRDVIDIFMLHEQESYDTLRGHSEALEYLMECRQKGIIKGVGVSMHHVAAVDGVRRMGDIDIIHPMLNVKGAGIVDGTREEMQEAIKRAKAVGIGVVSMKPFGGGMLFHSAGACLTYLKELPYVDCIAMGMQSYEEIDANVHFFENGFFKPEDEEKLKRKKRKLLIMDWCEGCGACMTMCKQNALTLQNSLMTVDEKKCVLCGYCGTKCPVAAMKIV